MQSAKRTRTPRVIIIGSGIGGIGMAVNLLKEGLTDITLLEQADDLGGVWRDNTYPGAACDVPSTLYSYSFARQTGFGVRYPGQKDILGYLRRIATEYGVAERVVFNAKVVKASFDEELGEWEVVTEDGAVRRCDVFIPSVGTLARPRLPEIRGREDFAGPAFHSARWRHDVDLAGKDIAVIGTGASALQFVPHLQRTARKLTIYQRSAPYIMPVHNYSYDQGLKQRFLGTRGMRLLDRFGFWLLMEGGQQVLSKWRKLDTGMSGPALKQLAAQVPDPELRAKLTPDHVVGCKRVLFSSVYYPAVSQPNVEVVTDRIEEITTSGVATTDGTREHEVIVYGTGFRTDDIMGHVEITGRNGLLLSDVWKEGAEAYLGISVKHFPNMFIVYGPNTDLGSGSIPYMLESQMRYIRLAVRHLAGTERGTAVEVKESVHDTYVKWIADNFQNTAWSENCSNWYTNDAGRIVTNWPQRSWRYRRRTRRFDPSVYRTTTAAGR